MTQQKRDIELIRDFKNGNARAFEKLFEIYHKRLYGFIFGLTKSKPDSEEIVQEAFVKVWENRNHYNEVYPFEAYLFKIAKNAFINHNRKQINRRIFEKNFEIFAEMTSNGADGQILFKETQLIVEAIINTMPPKRKEIFRLQKLEGLSRKEISQKLSISLVTIDSHLMKANQQFIAGLKKSGVLATFILLVNI